MASVCLVTFRLLRLPFDCRPFRPCALSCGVELARLIVAIFALIAYPLVMTTLTLDLPEELTAELDAAVEAGWFTSQAEAVRAAVRDMMSHRKLALLEKQQLADIDWAVGTASKRP